MKSKKHIKYTILTDKPIAIVKSPNTALLMPSVDNTKLWVALNEITEKALKPIAANYIIFYPPKGKFYECKKKANKAGLTNYKVSDLLEQCDFIQDGDDLADIFF